MLEFEGGCGLENENENEGRKEKKTKGQEDVRDISLKK